MLSVCPVLSVPLVYCGQSVIGWIRTSLGMEVGLGPGHIVLDGDPAPPRKGTQQPPKAPTFRPTVLWHGRPSQQVLSSCFTMSVASVFCSALSCSFFIYMVLFKRIMAMHIFRNHLRLHNVRQIVIKFGHNVYKHHFSHFR